MFFKNLIAFLCCLLSLFIIFFTIFYCLQCLQFFHFRSHLFILFFLFHSFMHSQFLFGPILFNLFFFWISSWWRRSSIDLLPISNSEFFEVWPSTQIEPRWSATQFPFVYLSPPPHQYLSLYLSLWFPFFFFVSATYFKQHSQPIFFLVTPAPIPFHFTM